MLPLCLTTSPPTTLCPFTPENDQKRGQEEDLAEEKNVL